MNQLVFSQPGVLAVSLPASRAGVGLLSSVSPLVLDKDRTLAEGSATLTALIGPLTSVGYLVLNEM